MEIDKDKVVEAARVLIECVFDKEITPLIFVEREELLIALKEALNPPPARPSKEECIDWLMQAYFRLGACPTPEAVEIISTIISRLKEPNLQWVRNTGVMPEGKTVVVRLGTGGLDFGDVRSFLWMRELSDTPELFVIEYIILE